MTTTRHGFSLKSGFRWLQQNMVLVFNLDSEKYNDHGIWFLVLNQVSQKYGVDQSFQKLLFI